MDWQDERDRLVDRLADGSRIGDDRVLEAIRSVPRHEFVPHARREEAYRDRPVPIGNGQTISAPHMVAMMAEILDLERGDAVLEIGTGQGYHAAVTAALVGAENVYSVEYHDDLAEKAGETLAATGFGDVAVRTGDGREGWPENAPYDRAYLTCAAPAIPDAIVEQIRPDGRLVAPIGTGSQQLISATRRSDGSLDRTTHCGVRFVEMQ